MDDLDFATTWKRSPRQSPHLPFAQLSRLKGNWRLRYDLEVWSSSCLAKSARSAEGKLAPRPQGHR
jgi:hypothetical protein